MPLRIISGRAGSGKSSRCHTEIAEIAKNGGKAVYIVPEQFSHEAESALAGKIGFISDRILATSFKRLAFSVLKSCAKDGLYADSRIKSMLMAKTLAELGPSLNVFASASRNPGFISSILDVISEFKRAALSPDDIMLAAEKIEDNDYFSGKMSELGRIYKKYSEAFTKNLADSQDTITAACELIKESPVVRGAHIYIDEFFRFTKQEFLFIEALLREKCDVTVALCADSKNSSGVFDPSLGAASRLEKICRRVGDNFRGVEVLEGAKRFSSPELSYLEREFTSYPPEKFNSIPKDINICEAPDIYTEITWLASKISRLVKENGLRYSDIGIIAGNSDRYTDILGTVFEYYDIPVFIDDKRNMLNHPLMLMLFSVFDIITDGFNTKDILAYIKTGFSPISEMEADILENHAIKSGAKKSDWLDDARFVLRARSVFSSESELTPDEQAQLISIKNKVIAPIAVLKRRLSESKKLSHRITALFEFFEDIKLFEKIVAVRDRLQSTGDMRNASELASVYEILSETLFAASEYMGESSVGLERLKAVLTAGFGDLSIGVVPTECDQVFLGDENRSVMKNIRVLFIIGANSGAFPAEVGSGGIFSDSERIFLEKQGLELAPDSKKRILDSRFSVYNILSSPKEKLYISYAISDFEGKGLRPSQLISNIRRIFPEIAISGGELFGDDFLPELISTQKSAYNYLVCNMAKNEQNPLTAAIKNELLKDESFRKRLEFIEKRLNTDQRAERLTAENVKALYGEKLTGSVSRFEKFSSCPFAYFAEYGLKAEERIAPSPAPTDTGSLLHSVIEIFSKKVYSAGKSFRDITEAECRGLISETVDELVFGSFIGKLYSEKKLSTYIERLKSLSQRSAIAICEHVKRGEFEPCAFEFSFNENGDTPPITLTLPNGAELSIIGKIDRVDRFCQGDKIYIKIIDYKSGSKQFSLSDVYNRLSLQLTVYLTAFISGDEHKAPAGMFYFRLSDPVTEASKSVSAENLHEEFIKKYKMSGLVLAEDDIVEAMEKGKTGSYSTIPIYRKTDGGFSERFSSAASAEDFKKLTEYVNKALCDIGSEIFSGNADISPMKNGKQTACDYCKYGSVCGAGKYLDVEYRNALKIDKKNAFTEMEKALNDE